MSFPGELARRLRMLFHHRAFQQDLQDEMQLHLELRQRQQVEMGLSPTAARQSAHRKFGNLTLLQEKSHMSWGWAWLESFVKDTAYGVRSMLRRPGLTAIALASLALGIGANTAIFSLLDAVMLRSLPVKDPAKLVLLGNAESNGITDDFGTTELYSYPFFRQLQKKNDVFSDTAAVFSMQNEVHGFVDGRNDSVPMNV